MINWVVTTATGDIDVIAPEIDVRNGALCCFDRARIERIFAAGSWISVMRKTAHHVNTDIVISSACVETDFDRIIRMKSKSRSGMRLVDWGCLGWKLAHICQLHNVQLIGADIEEPVGRPKGSEFFLIENGRSSVPDEYADVSYCSHVLEHMTDPRSLITELMRITTPGGSILIEAPSELSALRASSHDATDHSFKSFWDDPAHIRPWTPGSLYRLAISHRCFPLAISRSEAGGIPVVRMHAIKPLDTPKDPQWKYVSLENVPSGVSNAWKSVWGAAPALPRIASAEAEPTHA